METLYSLLRIRKNATQEDIRSAYLSLARRWHPDHKGGDTKVFQLIEKAYRILSNPQLRAVHDKKIEEYYLAVNAVECPGCGRGVKLKGKGVGQRCPVCKTVLQEWTAIGRFKAKMGRIARDLGSVGEEVLMSVAETTAETTEEVLIEGIQALGDTVKERIQKRQGVRRNGLGKSKKQIS